MFFQLKGSVDGTELSKSFVADLICKMNNGLNWVATLFVYGAVGHPPPLSNWLERTVLVEHEQNVLASLGASPPRLFTCDGRGPSLFYFSRKRIG